MKCSTITMAYVSPGRTTAAILPKVRTLIITR